MPISSTEVSWAHRDSRMAVPASLSELESTDLSLNALDFSAVKATCLSTHFWRGTFSWVDNPDILWVVDTERTLSATGICWASYTAPGTCIKVFRVTPPPILAKLLCGHFCLQAAPGSPACSVCLKLGLSSGWIQHWHVQAGSACSLTSKLISRSQTCK